MATLAPAHGGDEKLNVWIGEPVKTCLKKQRSGFGDDGCPPCQHRA
jgi:hypothetical protein